MLRILKSLPGFLFLLSLLLPAPQLPAQSVPDVADAQGHHFAARNGRVIYHRGQPFRMAGSNNYYPMYESQFMVDNVLTTAASQNFNTFRLWGFLDIGNEDGTNSVDGPHNGVYFHYWNGTEPAFNDGATGLEHLDYVIYKAGQLNLKLVIPFVNDYDQYGGMDQYVRWKGGQYHDQFYTDPTIRQWYKQWISHLLNHVNTYTGIKYKDDATIMTWELANEERCAGYGVYPQSPSSCTTDTITQWAADVSQYVKSIDRKAPALIRQRGLLLRRPEFVRLHDQLQRGCGQHCTGQAARHGRDLVPRVPRRLREDGGVGHRLDSAAYR